MISILILFLILVILFATAIAIIFTLVYFTRYVLQKIKELT